MSDDAPTEASSKLTDGAPYIGRGMKRVEDRVLLLGVGRYTDDIPMPGLLHVAFVRSPHAHARVRGLDTSHARQAPGVAAVSPAIVPYGFTMWTICHAPSGRR